MIIDTCLLYDFFIKTLFSLELEKKSDTIKIIVSKTNKGEYYIDHYFIKFVGEVDYDKTINSSFRQYYINQIQQEFLNAFDPLWGMIYWNIVCNELFLQKYDGYKNTVSVEIKNEN